jgi:hypothetical protein
MVPVAARWQAGINDQQHFPRACLDRLIALGVGRLERQQDQPRRA